MRKVELLPTRDCEAGYGLGPTKILMQHLSFSDNLLQNAYVIFQKSVDNFEIADKTC